MLSQSTQELAIGALSQSTGSVLIDGALGATIGYLAAPAGAEGSYATVVGFSSGAAGVFGLLISMGALYITRNSKNSRSLRTRSRSRR
jgi:hypothetical protein